MVIESASYNCNFTGTVINSLIIVIVSKYLSNSVLLLVYFVTIKTLRENGWDSQNPFQGNK